MSRAGSKAEKVAARLMQEEAQSRLPKVLCEGAALENVLSFRYLGSEIQADGDELLDPVRRMDLAKSAFFDLCHVWEASTFGKPPAYLRLRRDQHSDLWVRGLVAYGPAHGKACQLECSLLGPHHGQRSS